MATYDPSNKATAHTLSNGDLTLSSTSYDATSYATDGKSSGKWYFEVTVTSIGSGFHTGIAKTRTTSTYIGNVTDGYGWHTGASYGASYKRGASVSINETYGPSLSGGDVVGIAVDLDNGRLYLRKNGTWQVSSDPETASNPMFSGLPSGTYYIGGGSGSSDSHTINFGATSFHTAAPSGYSPWGGAPTVEADLSATEAQDTASLSLYNYGTVSGTFTGVESQDDFSIIASHLSTITGSLSATEVQDVFQGSATFIAEPFGTLSATETQDTLLSLGGSIVTNQRIYVACGAQRIFKSLNGITWEEVTHNIVTANTFYSLAQGGTRWVLTGTNNSIWYSDDLENWTATTTSAPSNVTWSKVRYGNGVWVAIGGLRVAYSTDGITWTIVVTATSNLNGLAFGDGNWVTCGVSGRLYSSADGVSWTIRSAGSLSTTTFSSAAWNGSVFMIGNINSYGGVMTSPTGATWTRRTDAGITINSLMSGTGRSVVSSPSAQRGSTNNGASWSVVSGPNITPVDGMADGTTFVEVGSTGSLIRYSTDGGATFAASTVPGPSLSLRGTNFGFGSGDIYIYGPMSGEEAQDTAAFTGEFVPIYIANMSATEEQDVLAMVGVSFSSGMATMDVTEGQDEANLFMIRDFADVTVDFSLTEVQDAGAFSATKLSPAQYRIMQITSVESPDTVTIRTSTSIRIAMPLTETPDALVMRTGGATVMPIHILPASFDRIVTYGASLFDGGTLTIRTGSQPDLPTDTATGTVLGIIDLPTPAFEEAEDGTATKAGDWESAAVATGVAGWFRLVSANGQDIIDGSVSTPMDNGNLLMNTTSLTVGDPLIVTTATFEFQLLDEL